MKLTGKQERFVEEYLVDLNGTQAAIRAGYSERSARSQANRLLTNDDIQKGLSEGAKARSERTKIDADWLLTRLAAEAEADIADLYTKEGSLMPVHDWPITWRQGLISGLDVEQQYAYKDGEKVPDGVVTKVKLSDRVKRLELIGRHIDVGAFKENEIVLPGSINIVINRPSGD